MPEIFEGFILLGVCGVGIVVIAEVAVFFFHVRERLKKRREKPFIRFIDD